ncbi:hypothetical protein E6C27_scaffold175G001870 [Cucumis melo var. makuwa]|uniref:Uncharacterized protein n=1 Tax=Cucumis melo var. makuwa TaxID=1194695 RepID=A0A5A7U835_CUCMM|nr:hypothetical protein E6C27_scaffold175G001870 [Cucumis melo var. makuwa]
MNLEKRGKAKQQIYEFHWTVAPPTRKGLNMEAFLPFELENLRRKSEYTILLSTKSSISAPPGSCCYSTSHIPYSIAKREKKRPNPPTKDLVDPGTRGF